MSEFKAEQLKAAAKSSVGVSFGAESLAFQVKVIAETLAFVEGQVDAVEAELDSMLAGTQGEWLKTIPGIDTVLASLIAGEIGDANRFASPKQLRRLCGIHGHAPRAFRRGNRVPGGQIR